MKIAATVVGMDAARNYTEVDYTNTTIQRGLSDLNSSNQPRTQFSGQAFQDNFFSLIQSSSSSQQHSAFSVASAKDPLDNQEKEKDSEHNLHQMSTISSMVEHVTGASVTMQQLKENSANGPGVPPLEVGSASLSSSVVHYEEESIFFQAAGEVQTEDGRAISFNLGLQMERQELLVQSAGMGSSIFGIDPLVLNFDETISIFDENYFSFDLDGDGEKEELSSLGSCCGFLALDRNGDGSINDGLELFGPSTDSGFGELAAFDDDGNSWIDENDPIFDDLMVWMGAGGEEDQLISLREAGVGAISVTNLGTQFSLENSDGTVQGIVQASGMFLMENGEPKSMLEIDMVPQVQEEAEPGIQLSFNPGNQEESSELGDDLNNINPENQNALARLSEIIVWQRMKMRLLFGKNLLDDSQNEMMNRLKHLTNQTKVSILS